MDYTGSGNDGLVGGIDGDSKTVGVEALEPKAQKPSRSR